MAPIVTRYPLDPTGISPDNLVVDEEHVLSNRPIKAFATNYGGYFTESIIVKEKATQLELVKGVDYYCAELYAVPTAKYGKEICSVVVITNPSITSEVQVTYQALGGPWSTSSQAIIQMMENLNLDDRPVTWGNIIGKPSEFNPAHHLHDSGDIYGFEYIVAELERIRQAILMGDVASHDEIYRYIDEAFSHLGDDVENLNNALQEHISDTNNPHQVTAEQVGTYTKAEIDSRSDSKLPLAGGTMTGPIIGSATGLAMVQGNNTNNGSMTFRAVGAGNDNLAGATFNANGYVIKLGLRNDGVFGLGGGNASAWRWYNDASGNTFQAGDCYIFSDPRLKENKLELTNALNNIRNISGYSFTWKDMGPKKLLAGKSDIGLMADEVEKVYPEMIIETTDENGDTYKTVAYTKFVPVLLQAVKELDKQIQELRSSNGNSSSSD